MPLSRVALLGYVLAVSATINCAGPSQPSGWTVHIELDGLADGVVTASDGQSCRASCVMHFAAPNVTLQVTPLDRFDHWEGLCQGGAQCDLNSPNGTVTARFLKPPCRRTSPVPDPPVMGDAGFTDPKTVLLEWQAPASECPVLFYTVENDYPAGNDDSFREQTNATVWTHEGNLPADGCVFVKANSARGASLQSEWRCVRLPRPPIGPNDVMAFPRKGAVDLYWLPPLPGQWASCGCKDVLPLLGQTIDIEPGGRTLHLPADALSASIDGLTDGTSYRFAVSIDNAAGRSEPTLSNVVIPPHSTWQLWSRLPTSRSAHGSAILNGRVWVFGGYNFPYGPDLPAISAELRADGALGAWRDESTPPADSGDFASTQDPPALYVVDAYSDGIFRAAILADGTLGEWKIAGKRPNTTFGGAAAAIAGGGLHLISLGDVWSARIAADGSLGPWVAGDPIGPANLYRQVKPVLGVDDRVYMLGASFQAPQMVARMDSSGALRGWRPLTGQVDNNQGTGLALGEQIYLANAVGILKGASDSTGDIAAWATNPGEHFIGPRQGAALVSDGSSLLLLGGSGAAWHWDVQRALLDPSTGALIP